MDFNKRTFGNFKDFFSRNKISIRLSIFSILLILLISVSVAIISINYFSLNSIFIKTSKNYLSLASSRVADQVSGYISPLNNSSLVARRIFGEGLIKPNKSIEFARLLYSFIADNHLSGAYWSDVSGDLYWINKTKGGGFVQEIISKENGAVRALLRIFDDKGNILAVDKNSTPSVQDPRIRPWYQQATDSKKIVWTIYEFASIKGQQAQLGITASQPIYNKDGGLFGVFAVDILLGDIVNYLDDLKLTKNSHVFIVDELGKIIASRGDSGEPHEIDDLSADWLKKSFSIYRDKNENSFVYKSNNKEYVSDYKMISDMFSKHFWHVGIVTPIEDIVAPLKSTSYLSLFLTLIVLGFGMIMASIFSASISKPIKKLAQDADFICRLKLEVIKRVISNIKEIAEMGDAFIKMKRALYSFQRYMSIALVKKLIVSNKVAEVGGEFKELTILFTDIKDFTVLSENLDPEKVMTYLSEYFQCVTKVIIDSLGTLDKYIGDGVMAFWGAPIDDIDHALHACKAALNIQSSLAELNSKWKDEGKPELVTRIGINTGRVVVGNVGSEDRLNYTSLGDQVNLASRLEGINKLYGTTIAVSEFTYKKTKDIFNFRLLDKVAVKGKTQGVYVYELLGSKTDKEYDLKLEQYNKEFYQAISLYFKGEWKDGLELFNLLGDKYPGDKIIKLFVKRCSDFIISPPKNWDGIWVVDRK